MIPNDTILARGPHGSERYLPVLAAAEQSLTGDEQARGHPDGRDDGDDDRQSRQDSEPLEWRGERERKDAVVDQAPLKTKSFQLQQFTDAAVASLGYRRVARAKKCSMDIWRIKTRSAVKSDIQQLPFDATTELFANS
jgi:hypothetical protein